MSASTSKCTLIKFISRRLVGIACSHTLIIGLSRFGIVIIHSKLPKGIELPSHLEFVRGNNQVSRAEYVRMSTTDHTKLDGSEELRRPYLTWFCCIYICTSVKIYIGFSIIAMYVGKYPAGFLQGATHSVTSSCSKSHLNCIPSSP